MPGSENDVWGGLEIDRQGFVYRRQQRLNLAPKEEAVLHLLLVRWPLSVSKADFAQHVWQKRPMSDEGLARCIARARQELGPDSPVAIKAEYGFGYRLVLPDENSGPVPIQSTKSHSRLMEAAKASAPLAETVAHCGHLIALRNDYGLEQAEKLLRATLDAAPDYIAARIMLAKCLAARVNLVIGDDENLVSEGLALLQADVERRTHAAGLLTQWAHLLDCAWRFREARECHLEAIRSFPHDGETYYHYGWHLLASGDPQGAVQAFRTATELHPFSVTIALLYARSLQSIGNVDAARQVVFELHERFPDNAVAALYWLTVQSIHAPSQQLYDEARKIHGSRVPWPLAGSNLAFIYARCGDIESSRRLIKATENASTALRATYMPPLFFLGEEDEALNRAEAAFSARCSLAPFMLRLQINKSMMLKSARGRDVLKRFDASMASMILGDQGISRK